MPARTTRRRSSHRMTKSQRARVMQLLSFGQREASAMDGVIRRGPMTIILVFSKTCPHCHTYMPIWNKLCKTKGRTANMISMESSVYNQTPLANKLPVSGVPSVLYVGPNGEPTEIQNPRDKATMTNVVKNSPSPVTSSNPLSSSSPLTSSSSSMNTSSSKMTSSSSSMNTSSSGPLLSRPVYTTSPDVKMSDNPLKPLPARGGSWDALFQQALPAAALIGAYAAFPMQRSSGLGPTRDRKTRRRHR